MRPYSLEESRTIDRWAARHVGLDLPPEFLICFGNPRVGVHAAELVRPGSYCPICPAHASPLWARFTSPWKEKAMQVPSVGRIVRYVEANGEEIPGIITRVLGSLPIVDLTVFPPGQQPMALLDVRGPVELGERCGTWHWPQRD